MKYYKILISFSICIISLFIQPAANAKEKQLSSDTIKVLFIGNSYTFAGNLPHIVAFLAESRNIPLQTRKSVAGGANLGQHWKAERNLKSKEKIKNGNFDIVILQDQSQRPLKEPDSTLYYAEELCKFIKKHGAKPGFYNTWAREKIPQQQAGLNKIYEKAAEENNAILFPIGQAWELARKLRPGIGIHSGDGSHPSDLGTYLSACVFFAIITGENPIGLPADISVKDANDETIYLMWIHPEDAEFCQRIAEEIVNKYKK